MAWKKSLIAAVFLVFCMSVVLLESISTTNEYDPWLDCNDDGEIDIIDIATVARAFGTSGTPINKTEMLLESQAILDVCFSPNDSCKNQLLRWISRANKSIHILIYSFTLDDVGASLIEAFQRGVDVKVLFEKSQISTYSECHSLHMAGVSVRNDTNSKSMHNKIMIIDGIVVLTGSFNYSKNAEQYNNENLIIIASERIAGIYEQEFLRIWDTGI